MASIHAFSPAEAALQARFGRWRQRTFAPVLRVLAALHVSPNALSILGLLSIFLVVPGFAHAPAWTIAAYVLHLAFDGLDGALARHTGTASPRGGVIDVVADHLAFVATVAILQWFGIGAFLSASLYVVAYLLLVTGIVFLNARGTPFPIPVLRTKYVLFVLVILCAYGVIDARWIDGFFAVFGTYYALMTAICAFPAARIID